MQEFFKKNKPFIVIFLLCFVFILLRFPSLFEPNWYGDEGIYQVIGSSLRHGKFLYQDIWDNKPPLLYIVYSLFYGEQYFVRFFSLIVGILATIGMYFLTRKLFTRQSVAVVSTAWFAICFGTPIIEGNIANAENFMLPLSIWAGYCLLLAIKRKKENHRHMLLVIFGLLMSISMLFKVVGVFDLVAFTIFFFCERLENTFVRKSIGRFLQSTIFLGIGLLIPMLITVGYFLIVHRFDYFFSATLGENFSYVNWKNSLPKV
jgi:4-amino-4-deoxy-L-arabinose transferase-like glycosyltransferase